MEVFYTIIVFILGFFGLRFLGQRNRMRMDEQRILDEKQVLNIIEIHFKKLDVISNERRWIGAESEIVSWRYPFHKATGFKQRLLCKSAKGAWFVVEYILDGFEITDVSVHQSDEATARDWLSPERDLYTKYFSLPETA